MNMETQATATPKSEGEEKQVAFEGNVARAAEIQKEIAEAAASGDFAKIGELSAEGAQLKSVNETVVAEDHQEGMEMNAEFDAEKSRQETEEAKAVAEEAATEQARFAQEAAEKATADQSAAEKLAEEIKSGAISGEGVAPEQPTEPSALEKAVAENNEINAIIGTKREERLKRIEEMVAHSPEKSPAERLKLYLEDTGDEFYRLSPEELHRATLEIRKAQGVENYQMFTKNLLPDGQFISHNGSVLVSSGDSYYWTRNQSRVDEIRALGFKDGDSGVDVPFANTTLDEFKWGGMARSARAVEDTLNDERKQAKYEIRNKQV